MDTKLGRLRRGTASGLKLTGAVVKAAAAVLRDGCTKAERWVGTVTDDQGEGVTVSVSVYRYSAALKAADPDSGGIVVFGAKKRKPRAKPAKPKPYRTRVGELRDPV